MSIVSVFANELPNTGASEATLIGISVTAAVLLVLGVGATLVARKRRK
jgi:LPXTG-motif cell wall-anchored protein